MRERERENIHKETDIVRLASFHIHKFCFFFPPLKNLIFVTTFSIPWLEKEGLPELRKWGTDWKEPNYILNILLTRSCSKLDEVSLFYI